VSDCGPQATRQISTLTTGVCMLKSTGKPVKLVVADLRCTLRQFKQRRVLASETQRVPIPFDLQRLRTSSS